MSAYATLITEHPLPWKREQALGGWWQVTDSSGIVVMSALAQRTDSTESIELVDLIVEAANRLGTLGAWVPLRPMEDAPVMYGHATVFAHWGTGWAWASRRESEETWRDVDYDRIETPSGWIDTADLPTPVTGEIKND